MKGRCVNAGITKGFLRNRCLLALGQRVRVRPGGSLWPSGRSVRSISGAPLRSRFFLFFSFERKRCNTITFWSRRWQRYVGVDRYVDIVGLPYTSMLLFPTQRHQGINPFSFLSEKRRRTGTEKGASEPIFRLSSHVLEIHISVLNSRLTQIGRAHV